MHATHKERYLYLCLLAAIAGFLLGLAIVKHNAADSAGSRISWPSPTELRH
ncbi:MAG TPA: hypothetical protein VFB27_11080 [Opitutaceae bacterium]|nr:hypothetical protein [Opitutaceae bacterium]